ncbi:conserved hypothetical protein [Pseudomonas protegens Pf-5]|uniref:Uncharacterized protein n=1 Tax=Pseudomonas fluorescens (strain ATCC BAA-477 / NRRL B-23932 / Pf-5) TaxID=220664 RepID=Q4KEU7_PSEF5|nr:conserved hypothetical protein [Pseudomonas protegens Pf-5]
MLDEQYAPVASRLRGSRNLNKALAGLNSAARLLLAASIPDRPVAHHLANPAQYSTSAQSL